MVAADERKAVDVIRSVGIGSGFLYYKNLYGKRTDW